MSTYALVKTLHIISSTFLFGTGIGSAFYMLFASLQRDARVIAFVVRYVVIADWLFTSTSVIVQPLSGLYLVHLAGYSLQQRWILWSIGLYLLAGACWLPVVWLQLRMRDLAANAVRLHSSPAPSMHEAPAASAVELPPLYWRYFRIWVALGIPAFFALVVVFYLMVAKPL